MSDGPVRRLVCWRSLDMLGLFCRGRVVSAIGMKEWLNSLRLCPDLDALLGDLEPGPAGLQEYPYMSSFSPGIAATGLQQLTWHNDNYCCRYFGLRIGWHSLSAVCPFPPPPFFFGNSVKRMLGLWKACGVTHSIVIAGTWFGASNNLRGDMWFY